MSTLLGESVVEKRVCRNCSMMFPNKVSFVELVELHMLDFDVIYGMDRLHNFFASINCRTRVVNFNFPNEPIL